MHRALSAALLLLAACSRSGSGVVGTWTQHEKNGPSENEIFDTLRVRSNGTAQRTWDRYGRGIAKGHDRQGGDEFHWRTMGAGDSARFCVRDTPTAEEQCMPFTLAADEFKLDGESFQRVK